jgi:hypothetical protein
LYPLDRLVVNILLFVAFHHLVLWSFLGLSQWVYVRDDMSKGLKIMSLGVINHGMSLSVQTNFEKTMFVQA